MLVLQALDGEGLQDQQMVVRYRRDATTHMEAPGGPPDRR